MPLSNPAQRTDWSPPDQGLVGWSYDPSACTAASIMPTAGTLNVVKIKLAGPTLVTAIQMLLQTAGGTLTAGQCFAMVFDSAGTRVGVTADMAATWAGSPAYKDMPLTAPVQINGPYCSVGLYGNGTTLPTWRLSVASATPGNTNLTPATARYGYADTGLTTTPPTTLGTITTIGLPWWIGLR